MKPEIKTVWTAALRSDRFHQGQGRLRRDDLHCCLGVLCDLAAEDGLDIKYDPRYSEYTAFNWGAGYYAEGTLLPPLVSKWAELDSPNPEVDGEKVAGILRAHGLGDVTGQVFLDRGAPTYENTYLADLNDAGVPFPVMAEIIDACL